MTVSFKLVGDSAVKARLKEIAERAKNPGMAMALIANMMRKDVIDHFDKEKGESGSWEPLAESTRKWKAARGYSKMLQNTGFLRRSTVPESGRDFAKVVNAAPYARAQNDGVESRGLPARDFMYMSAAALKRATRLMANFIRQGL